jgi:hypothetical protein
MKALMVTRYDALGASSRLRHMQYAPALAQAGFETTFDPFFDGEYLARLYAGQSTSLPALGAYARRVRQLARAEGYDVLWLEKEALPWLPWALEKRLLPRGVPLVVDFDDAAGHGWEGRLGRLR